MESRFVQLTLDDPLTRSDHLMYDVLDSLNYMSFNVSVCAAGAAKKEYKKIMRKAPKPLERPTLKPRDKPKRKFVTGKELQQLLPEMISNAARG